MTKTRLTLLSIALGLQAFAQTPAITQVGNAASYSNDIAEGSIFVVIGSNLGPATLIQAGSLPLTTLLSGTSVRFAPAGGGAAVDAFMVYTSARQVAALLPSTAAVGNYNVTVTYNGATSAVFASRVVQRGYGMITVNSAGTGLAVLQNASAGNAINLFTSPARPGNVMVLWGTGLGPIRVPDNAAPGVQDLRADVAVRVIVGNIEVEPVYAGRSPNLPGADQINFTIPANAATGCSVSLQVRVGDQLSAPANIAIAPAGRAVCEHPFLSEDSLRKIDTGANAVYGYFSLSASSFSLAVPGLPIPAIDFKSESVGGAFTKLTLGSVADITNQATPPLGTCRVQRQRIDQSGQAVVEVAALDAGAITLNGPNVANKTLMKTPSNYYSLALSSPGDALGGLLGGTPPPPVIAAGTYTLAGAGGADIGAFSGQVRVSTPVNWTNRDQIAAIIRTSPLTINWSGGGGDDIVTIVGISGSRVPGSSDNNPLFDGAQFYCFAAATAGTFTVPTSILQQLPAAAGFSVGLDGADFNSIGLLSVNASNGNAQNGRFTAPLRAGGNIDFGFLLYSFGGAKVLPVR